MATANFRDLTQAVSGKLATLRTDTPDLMKGFNDMAKAATRDGALDKKTKELIALALGVARTATPASVFMRRRWCGSGQASPRSKKRWEWRCTWEAARR